MSQAPPIPAELKNFKSCEFKPIPLRKDQEDVAVLFQLPPDPLHVNLLGCGNDALECMEKFFPQAHTTALKMQKELTISK